MLACILELAECVVSSGAVSEPRLATLTFWPDSSIVVHGRGSCFCMQAKEAVVHAHAHAIPGDTPRDTTLANTVLGPVVTVTGHTLSYLKFNARVVLCAGDKLSRDGRWQRTVPRASLPRYIMACLGSPTRALDS